jgi:hypothetical protein
MEKTATITRTVFKNEWNNPKGGQIFYHDIELDNGDKGSIGSKEKEPAKLNPGQSLTYTLENGKIKAVQPQSAMGGFKKQPANNASFAMAYAKDVVIGSWNEHSPKKLTSEELFKIADKMFAWMEEKK